MIPSLVTVRGLTAEFSGRKVLDNLSFEIREGEILGVIGRSGAGKTVLMHLLRGIEEPPAGGQVIYHMAVCDGCGHMDVPSQAGTACLVCGKISQPMDIDLWDPSMNGMKEKVLHRTAIMFQRTFALYGDDRVIENVLKALDDIGYPQERAIPRAADLLDQVRLSHRMMHIARNLSGGEKQRVVLARQLAKEPSLLFADEPTGTLDPKTASLVHQMLIKAVESNRMGMVITSHFSEVISDVADRVMLLEGGRIATIGAPDEVISRFLAVGPDTNDFDRCEIGHPILISRNISKRYVTVDRGIVKAVHDASFEVKEREIFGIIGTSGAGKTTLSRIITGIIEPTSGEMNIRVGDTWVDMTKPGIEERGRAKGSIGLLHQEYDLFPHRTVLDNLTDSIGLELPKELARRKAVISLTTAGFDKDVITAVLDRYPGQLSEGERHRVALAQVLIREPSIVVLDEPTGTMDPITKRDVKHSILHAREEMDETFIIVSHDIGFVRDICDRVALMRGGRVVRVGPPSEVLEELSDYERLSAGIAG